MTNKERYKKAFSTLHASDHISLEVTMMEKRKSIYRMKKVAAACAAVVLACGSMTVAYAADLGGIQQKIDAWIHGEKTEVNAVDHGNGHYTYTFTDENGDSKEMGGGGIAIDEFGNETPLSAEEVLEQAVNSVEADEDGKVWLYYYDKKIEITDLFNKENICKVALNHNGQTVYFKIQKGDDDASGNYSFERRTQMPEDADHYQLLE